MCRTSATLPLSRKEFGTPNLHRESHGHRPPLPVVAVDSYLCACKVGLLHELLLLVLGWVREGAVFEEPVHQQVGNVLGEIGTALLGPRLRRVLNDEDERIALVAVAGTTATAPRQCVGVRRRRWRNELGLVIHVVLIRRLWWLLMLLLLLLLLLQLLQAVLDMGLRQGVIERSITRARGGRGSRGRRARWRYGRRGRGVRSRSGSSGGGSSSHGVQRRDARGSRGEARWARAAFVDAGRSRDARHRG